MRGLGHTQTKRRQQKHKKRGEERKKEREMKTKRIDRSEESTRVS